MNNIFEKLNQNAHLYVTNYIIDRLKWHLIKGFTEIKL